MRKVDSYRPLSPSRSGSGRATPSTYDSADDDAWRRGDCTIRGASMARTPSHEEEDRAIPPTKNDRKDSGVHFDNHDVQKKWKARQNFNFKSLIKVPAPKAPKEWPPKQWPNVESWRKDCPRCGGIRHTAVAQQCNRLCRLCGTFQHIGGRCPRNRDGNNRNEKSPGNGTHNGDLEKKRDLFPERVTKAEPVEKRQDQKVINHSFVEKRQDEKKVAKPTLVERKHDAKKVVNPTLVEKRHDEKKVVKPTLVEKRLNDGNHGRDMELDEPWRNFSFKLGATDQKLITPTLSNAAQNEGMHRDSGDYGGRSTASRTDSVSERRSSTRWDVRPKDDWDQSNRLTPIDFGNDDRRQSGRLTPVDFGNNDRSQANRLGPPFEYGDNDRGRFSQTPHMDHHQHRGWEEPPLRSRADQDIDMAYRRDDGSLPDLRTENEQLRSNCDNFRTRSEKLFSQNLTLLRDREMLRRQLELVGMEKRRQATTATSTTNPNCFDPSFWLRQMQMAELERMRAASFDASASLRQQQLEMAEAEKRRSNDSDASPQMRKADVGDMKDRMARNPDNPFALRQQQQHDMAGMEQRPANGFDMALPVMMPPMSLPGMPFGAAFAPPQFHPLEMDRSWLGGGFHYPM
ncbi:uncharacterized protein J3D65DRAFT_628585 [Phyllosticta citribraziliensis]|uniref:Uncharacterized protein n=1 Tax=Phyllosticta citribraziliensis TaxID=989973 RepID=A0ABR1LMM4_9PEZI